MSIILRNITIFTDPSQLHSLYTTLSSPKFNFYAPLSVTPLLTLFEKHNKIYLTLINCFAVAAANGLILAQLSRPKMKDTLSVVIVIVLSLATAVLAHAYTGDIPAKKVFFFVHVELRGLYSRQISFAMLTGAKLPSLLVTASHVMESVAMFPQLVMDATYHLPIIKLTFPLFCVVGLF